MGIGGENLFLFSTLFSISDTIVLNIYIWLLGLDACFVVDSKWVPDFVVETVWFSSLGNHRDGCRYEGNEGVSSC